MAITDLTAVAAQIEKYWSPLFTKQLRAQLLLGSLADRSYEGSITKGGDRVRVSQVNAPTGELLTIGTDADTFRTEALSTSYINITANKRAVAAFEFQDVVDLQSQIGNENPAVMESLMYAMSKQINKYLYSLVSPSTASPDHLIASVTDLNSAAMAANRILAGAAKWPKDKPWYALVDSTYYMDIATDTTLSSSDFNAGDPVVVAGEVASKRYGFNVLEDNYLPTDHGLFFYPDFLHMVSQTQASVKISDLHAQKKFGVIMSVDLIFGAALGIGGDEKHITNYNSAWAPNG